MNDSEKAFEHLRVIRTLMEKANVYRAVTVPTALVGGGLAIFTSLGIYLFGKDLSAQSVIAVWLGIFVLVNAFHHGLIFQTARRESEPYLSGGLRMALKAITPALFTGGLLSLAIGFGPEADLVAATFLWVLSYGLALMATSGFSPRSLRYLGLAFTLLGAGALACYWGCTAFDGVSPVLINVLTMGLSFGIFHLVYGLAVRASQRQLG